MAPSSLAMCCTAAALGFVSVKSAVGFMAPTQHSGPVVSGPAAHHGVGSASAAQANRPGWAAAAAVSTVLGAHVGLAVAMRSRTARRAAEAKETTVAYKESAADAKLFETVFMDYTREYVKGPMYWHENKLQGYLPDYPGEPMWKNGKMTSNAVGNLKTFSSNELAFLSFLFFSIGLYGNLQFNYYDFQWAVVDNGGLFNVSYIVESFFLPISFFMHIAAYIQKKNGK